MARYINADALEMELCRETFQPRKYCYPCREVFDALDGIPTADVRENKRGRWKWNLADNGWADWTCSECGYTKNTDIHVTLGWKIGRAHV